MKKKSSEFDEVTDFESGIKRLEDLVKTLETGNLPLEQAVLLYKEGLFLSQTCKERLDKAENEISILTEKGFKSFKVDEPGDPEADES
ncbi:exodeoxyribonuclease VII small subunit [Desulfovibrio litoralis]|uniref:Exodeoxyribonuclease 7 small subunit n=1 Tax=Desulfovibrio litoralis DSM 11393 TaxID=1121455 RepID=A0A1M7S6I9_9BACT|nr:exodeoxyribonuclease VII small subunit [Desulfovibrio litoralis]SHN54060.1 Exodeoxyribonuclease VII small subunit [Desulfovibrio litoralis DSM 11393]